MLLPIRQVFLLTMIPREKYILLNRGDVDRKSKVTHESSSLCGVHADFVVFFINDPLQLPSFSFKWSPKHTEILMFLNA